MKSLSKYAPFIYLLINSCTTPYYYLDDPSQFRESIVVQGMITDQPGPYEVTVSRTIPVQDQGADLGILDGAAVVIEDDQGHTEHLVEHSPGHFFTTSIQGVIGNTYTITVTTQKDYVYKSAPEKLLPVGDFDIRYEFKVNEDTLANLQVSSTNGFNILINSELLPEQQGRIWWRSTGIYHVVTFPGERKAWASGAPPPNGAPAVQVPDPPPCAGNKLNPLCTCCDCWITEYNQVPTISDQRFINNNEIKNLSIAFVQANRRNMYDKYYLEIQQLSASEAVYNFWKRVAVQKSNSSNLFQTADPKTGGNLVPVSDDAAPVIGYFAASAVKKKVLILTKADVPYRLYQIDEIDDSCLTVFKGSTNEKPLFW